MEFHGGVPAEASPSSAHRVGKPVVPVVVVGHVGVEHGEGSMSRSCVGADPHALFDPETAADGPDAARKITDVGTSYIA